MADVDSRDRQAGPEPLKSSLTILEEEISEAEMELERPAQWLFASGLMAGLGMGVGLLLMGIVATLSDGPFADATTALLLANAHAVGFIIVIMGRTDLFTEYTTLAILPVLEGRASVADLSRFWGWIYVANIIGAAAFAGTTAFLGPALGVIDSGRLAALGRDLIVHAWWVILPSAVVAGWLMGWMAWLVTSGRDTISQLFFVWLIALCIALAHLHHSISGFALVFFGWLDGAIGASDVGRFILWATIGNAAGGVLFAVLTRYRTTLRSM